MCGITGIFQTPHASRSADLAAIGPMTRRLRHRGPDADGYWSDYEAGVAFGHRRLAIIDLTDAGRQPMFSSSGRFVITFNGEIYNYRSLRQELESQGQNFDGNSDTEVLLAMIEKWGLETALRRSNGMFAIGLWDRRDRILHLARDRMGKKPLYVARTPNAVAFASELKAITAFPDFRPAIDTRSVSEFLGRGWLPEDHCIWQDVFKLPPGSILSFACSRSSGFGRDDATREIPFLVVGDRRCQTGPSNTRARRRPRTRVACQRPASRRGGGPHGRRRAGRAISIGRHRQLDHRRPDAISVQPTRPHLHDRVRRAWLRRGGQCGGRGAASRHKSHRATPHLRGGPGGHSRTFDGLGRAVRR